MASGKQEKIDLFQRIASFIENKSFAEEKQAKKFNFLAIKLFFYQYTNNPVYHRIARLSGVIEKKKPSSFEEIPLLAISLFKDQKIFSGEEEEIFEIFFSSGTTQKNRSKHFLSREELKLYQLSLRNNFKRAFNLSKRTKINYLALSESYQDRPNNSLVFMFNDLAESLFKIKEPKQCFLIKNSSFDFDLLKRVVLKSKQENCKILIVGTSLAFYNLISHLKSKQVLSFNLSKDSLIMETGGFKTQEKTISRQNFYKELSEFFDLKRENIINQYGMSEIGTQFYDFYQNNSCKEKLIPHWCKVRILDPRNLRQELPNYKIGIIAIYDLTNLDSCAFILTEDLGFKTHQDTLQITGRLPRANLKGCSLNNQDL